MVISEYTGEAIKVYGLPEGMALEFEEPNAPLTQREKLRRKLRRMRKRLPRNKRRKVTRALPEYSDDETTIIQTRVEEAVVR